MVRLLWGRFTASPGKLHASGYRSAKYGCPNVRKTKTCNAKYTSDTVLGEFLLNFILNVINAQKSFDQIKSPLIWKHGFCAAIRSRTWPE